MDDNREALVEWIKSATDEQVMSLCAQMVVIAPHLAEVFRCLAIVLVSSKDDRSKEPPKGT